MASAFPECFETLISSDGVCFPNSGQAACIILALLLKVQDRIHKLNAHEPPQSRNYGCETLIMFELCNSF